MQREEQALHPRGSARVPLARTRSANVRGWPDRLIVPCQFRCERFYSATARWMGYFVMRLQINAEGWSNLRRNWPDALENGTSSAYKPRKSTARGDVHSGQISIGVTVHFLTEGWLEDRSRISRGVILFTTAIHVTRMTAVQLQRWSKGIIKWHFEMAKS